MAAGGKSKKKKQVSRNLGRLPTSLPSAHSGLHVPPPICLSSVPPPLYSIPHLGYTAMSSTPYYYHMSFQDINGTFSSRSACPSMPTPRPAIPPSSTPVIHPMAFNHYRLPLFLHHLPLSYPFILPLACPHLLVGLQSILNLYMLRILQILE